MSVSKTMEKSAIDRTNYCQDPKLFAKALSTLLQLGLIERHLNVKQLTRLDRATQAVLTAHLSNNYFFQWELHTKYQIYQPTTFGVNFNQQVDKLPSSLRTLQFGGPYNQFNQTVNNLPGSLTYVKFGDRFNQPINMLPSTITRLVLGKYFRQPLNCLPSSLLPWLKLKEKDGFYVTGGARLESSKW
eukprot:TRINITY_DN2338_c0_g1_i1.p1 TRINITY_DN2338_c0_g1~~TRINITY_DN2338_c0_g1_i1.p1  ORF type:complete len:187 (-),score=15.20 TRINITY_DN2338_c0_g1_i1:149-709(-)